MPQHPPSGGPLPQAYGVWGASFPIKGHQPGRVWQMVTVLCVWEEGGGAIGGVLGGRCWGACLSSEQSEPGPRLRVRGARGV